MKVACPGCQTELDPTNTHCPVCLRARSRKEMLAGLSDTRRPPPTRWGRVLLLLIAAGGTAFGALVYLNRPAPPPAPAPNPRAAAPPAPAPAAPAPDAAAAAAAGGEATPSGTVVLRQPTAAAEGTGKSPAEDGDETAPPSRRRSLPARPKGWRVAGEVYDLLSLKPVAGAKIVFQDKDSGNAFTAVTDAAGKYNVALPKVLEGGYELTVAHRKYSGVYLEEMSPPYRSQSRARRLEAAQQMSESAVLHVPLLPEYSAVDVPYDVVLFPRQ